MDLLSRHKAVLLCAGLLLQGCATSSALHSARDQFYSGQAEKALTTLDVEGLPNRNRVLGYLDKGVIAHTAGHYRDSSKAFLAASSLLDQLDFVSVKEQSTSLLTNDWVTSYKGEYSERLWIHTFQMMNFLLLDEPAGAAVEARQALKVIDQHGDSLKHDWYSRALIAMSFEAAGNFDSAHIEYRKLFDDVLDSTNSNTAVSQLAWQNAKRLGRREDAKTFAKTLPADVHSSNTELIVFIGTGAIPHKLPADLFISTEMRLSFPTYPELPRPDAQISASVNGISVNAPVVKTQLVNISRSALAARGKRVAAKQITRLVAKKALTDAAYKESSGLGGIIGLAMLISEQADLRSWETLPAHLSMLRLPMEPGEHSVSLQINDGSRQHEIVLDNVRIDANRRTYRAVRAGVGAPVLNRAQLDDALTDNNNVDVTPAAIAN